MTKIQVNVTGAKKIKISDGKEEKKAAAKPAAKKVKKIAISTPEKKSAGKIAKKTAPAKASKKETKKIAKANAEILKLSRQAKIASEKQARIAEKQAKVAKKAERLVVKKQDQAIKSAMHSVATMNTKEPSADDAMPRKFNKKRRGRRVFFALICSAATVGTLVAFVHFNMPDLSVRVAAMQTGIEATYPTFVPRNYSLSNVTSEKDGEVVMYFTGPDGAAFSLSEEKSTWDSTALLNNYVKKTYPSDYTTLREQGITIYLRGENASWVNGGLLYKIHATGKNLTKEQIRNIATSL